MTLVMEKLCKRYIELNDYNIDMGTTLESAFKKGLINMKVDKNVIGGNPFLPISIIEWNSTKELEKKLKNKHYDIVLLELELFLY